MTNETMTAADVDWCRREWGWLCAVNEDSKAAMYQRILATYAECERLRAQLAAAQEDTKRRQEWVRHLSFCATCADGELPLCDTGREIAAALSLIRTAISGIPAKEAGETKRD